MQDLKYKSYLIRATYEYCIDHGLVPMLSYVVTDHDVPVLKNNANELNITTLSLCNKAIRELVIDENHVSFTTRFNGKIEYLRLDVDRIIGIGSQCNTAGLTFGINPEVVKPAAKQKETVLDDDEDRPQLKLI